MKNLSNKFYSSLGTRVLGIFILCTVFSSITFAFLGNRLLYRALDNNATVVEYNLTLAIIFVISLIVFVVIFFAMFKRILTYIKEMESGISKMAGGDFKSHINVKGKDELSSLSEHINMMAVELQSKFEKERRLEKDKAELFTNISHDLRTPLTSIVGFLQAIKEHRYDDDDERDEYIDIIYRKSRRLQTLIDDLFELAKLQQAEAEINLQVIDLNTLIEQYVSELEVSLSEGISIERNLCKEVLLINADVKKLMRVVENILSNAVRYCLNPGKIAIVTFRSHSEVIWKVSNPSEPISESEMEKIFHRFYKKDFSRTNDGSGLGLVIVKSIVSLHGGRVWAEYDNGLFSISVSFQLHICSS